MKISITTNNKVFSVEDELGFDCTGLHEAVEMVKGLLVCAGFHPSNVDDAFNTEYTWFTEEERNDNMQGHLSGSNKIVEDWYEECKNETSEEKQKRIEEFQADLYKQSLKD
tara:strand:- start:16061 stop:16393 length:333 start_codon:yes stop_codon:yes gene_type:complete